MAPCHRYPFCLEHRDTPMPLHPVPHVDPLSSRPYRPPVQLSAYYHLPLPLIFVKPPQPTSFFFFFFNDPAPPEFYPLPLHAAFPILHCLGDLSGLHLRNFVPCRKRPPVK